MLHCSACHELLDLLSSPTDAATETDPTAAARLERRQTIDRFVIRRTLGRGGLGIVYLAFDPLLDREVAVKVLQPGVAQVDGIDRLEREARSLARVEDEHVVRVYEVGRTRDEVWMAMEVVVGQTIDRWISKRSADVSAIVELLQQAGDGLHAAHRAGIVHCDIKPANIMVRDTVHGPRAVLIDFGLSVSDHGLPTMRSDGPAAADTMLSKLAGTPAYMAPEQHTGTESTALSDQYSFYVTAFELLCGRRPFLAGSLQEQRNALRERVPRTPLRRRGVPRRIEDALVRGLHVDPQKRWRDMPSLLAELHRGSTRRSLVGMAGAATAVLGAAAILGHVGTPSACAADAGALAAVWDGNARKAVVAQLADRPEQVEPLLEILDHRAATYADVHRIACRADIDEPAATVVHRCLQRQVETMAIGVELISGQDAVASTHAVEVALSLPTVQGCLHPANESHDTATPLPALQRRELESELIRARALLRATDLEGARDHAERAVTQARGSGGRLLARALLTRAELSRIQGKQSEAGEDWAAALREARRVEAHDLAAEAGTRLALTVQRSEAAHWIDQAIADAQKSEEPETMTYVLMARAMLETRGDRRETAIQTLAEARSLLGRVLDDKQAQGLEVHLSEREAEALAGLNRAHEALQARRENLAAVKRLYGPANGRTALATVKLGVSLCDTGHLDEALVTAQQGFELTRAVHGDSQLFTGQAMRILGGVEFLAGKQERGRERLEAAVQLFRNFDDARLTAAAMLDSARVERHARNLARSEQTLREALLLIRVASGLDRPEAADVEAELALTLMEAGALEEASALVEHATLILERSEATETVAFAHDTRGRLALAQGRPEAAAAHHEAAIDVVERKLGPDASELLPSLVWLARSELSAGRRPQADRVLARANRIHQRTGFPPTLAHGNTIVEQLRRLNELAPDRTAAYPP